MGPVVSGHTPPVYTVDEGVITRVRSAEDDARLAFAGLVTLYHTGTLPWLGASFGMGLDSDARLRYYAGPAFRFGGKGVVSAGVALGPIARLPAGLQEGDRWVDINTVQVESRIATSWYVAFSYAVWDGGAMSGQP